MDVYQVHNLVAVRSRLAQLERLKAEGRVRVIGVTHAGAHAFTEMRRTMTDPRVGAIQIPYNPFGRFTASASHAGRRRS